MNIKNAQMNKEAISIEKVTHEIEMEGPTVRTIKDWLINGIDELPKEAPKDRFRVYYQKTPKESSQKEVEPEQT